MPDNVDMISAIRGQHLVTYYWCGKSSRMFQFRHYLGMKSVIRALHPDAIFFLYEEYPGVDELQYNVWLEELKLQFPFIYFEKLKNGGACRETAGDRREVIAGILAKRGGFYVHENTMLTPIIAELQNKRNVYAVDNTSGQGFLMIEKGLAFGDKHNTTIICKDARHISGYFHAYCINTVESVRPKDIWDLETPFGELARWAAYGETSIQRPEPNYRDIAPNIAHYVWIGNGRMDFAFYLSVLSLIYVAKVDKSVSGASHRSDIWRLDLMNKYGGLYLDTDVIFVKPISNHLRAYEAVMSLSFTTFTPFPDRLQSGVMLGKRGGKFWNEFMKTMRTYRDDLWTWNVCFLPYKVKEIYPKSVLIYDRLQVCCPKAKCHPTWWPNYHNRSINHLNTNTIPDWRTEAYSYHFVGGGTPPELRNEKKARRAKTMFGEMARFVLEEAGLLNTD
ncbi:hypothetical protein LSH36_252g03041 [Paralvinella palmiformis]|uniref:Alpha 1,4-glycosyltransferase domain-containing protein n=1 Tax=Paralvinella palmiformis TaxID=53620 RepID=A0AAD9N4R2_9ANNE|nr:hypothetical protein LSH36_252g03041 [Paralvinella palmiformis]